MTPEYGRLSPPTLRATPPAGVLVAKLTEETRRKPGFTTVLIACPDGSTPVVGAGLAVGVGVGGTTGGDVVPATVNVVRGPTDEYPDPPTWKHARAVYVPAASLVVAV